jgi:hypothetical protein
MFITPYQLMSSTTARPTPEMTPPRMAACVSTDIAMLTDDSYISVDYRLFEAMVKLTAAECCLARELPYGWQLAGRIENLP